jgi:hypothetical protein
MFPPEGLSLQLVTVLITAVVGAFAGAWFASMAASAVPNSKLKPFAADMEAGKVLMMVDVPFSRVNEVSGLVAQRHPEAVSRGAEPTIPAFP